MSATIAGVAGEHRLDRAVAAVAHPAFEAARERLVLDKGAEADALHAAACTITWRMTVMRVLRHR